MDVAFFKEVFEKLQTDHNVIILEAPTAAGKTTGCIKYLKEYTKKKTIMILPTKISLPKIDYSHLHFSLPLPSISHLHKYEWIVVDECHFLSNEYQFLFRYLCTMKNKKILFMSATVNQERMKEMFPMAHWIKKESGNCFTKEILYLVEEDEEMVRANRHFAYWQSTLMNFWNNWGDQYNRVICFVASQEQCLNIMNNIQKKEGFEHVCYFGNMDDDEKKEVESKMFRSTNRIFIVCTNILETSVNIPKVDLVIDFGIHIQKEHGNVEFRFCDQWNMIQRGGRTGRTCNGTVVRMCSQAFFESLPYQNIPSIDEDWVYFYCSYKQLPLQKLMTEGEKNSVQKKIKAWNLQNIHPKHFINSPLSIKGSAMMHSLMNSKMHSEKLFILLAICVIDYYETSGKHFFFYHSMMKNSKLSLLKQLRILFQSREELLLACDIWWTLHFHPKPTDFATKMSLNFKTYRLIAQKFKRCLDMYGLDDSLCKERLDKTLTNVYQMKGVHKESIRYFFSLDCRIQRYCFYGQTEYVMESNNNIARNNIHGSKYIYAHVMNRYEGILQISLWHLPPAFMRTFYDTLNDRLMEQKQIREETRSWKRYYHDQVVGYIKKVLIFVPHFKVF